MASATTTKSKSTTRRRTAVQNVTTTPMALKQEKGRRRNNKARKAAGEPTVRAKAFWMPALGAKEFQALENGESVNLTFGTGRKVKVTCKA